MIAAPSDSSMWTRLGAFGRCRGSALLVTSLRTPRRGPSGASKAGPRGLRSRPGRTVRDRRRESPMSETWDDYVAGQGAVVDEVQTDVSDLQNEVDADPNASLGDDLAVED